MGRSRLVSRAELSMEDAQKKAEEFLARMDYTDLALYSSGGSETVAVFRFAPTQDGIMRPDDGLSVSIALDNGEIFALDATDYSPWEVELSWNTDEEEARATLPEGVEAVSSRRLILKTLSGAYLPCWELQCADDAGQSARVYVDAGTGRQYKIEI
jgi:spore germination protein